MNNIDFKKIYKNIDKFLDKEIVLQGWIRTVRTSKDFGFIELNDGTFFKGIQIVFEKELKNFDEISKITIGSAIKVEGKLIKSLGQGQFFELKAEKIIILSKAESDYPLQKKRHSFEFLRTIAHLRGRSNTFSAVFRLRSVLSFAIHKFFNEKNFVYIHAPIISTSDCEGAGEMFKIVATKTNNEGKIVYDKNFFNKEAGLTVSGQLNAEALAMSFKNVYSFGPTFRAENSNTARHAAEFWMLEPEISFANLKDDMDLAEEMIKYLISYVVKECPEEIEFFNKFIDNSLLEKFKNILNSEFKRIEYTEAIEILEKSKEKFIYPVKWGIDLQTEHERYLTDKVFQKPVFVINYPKDIKAFYMKANDDGKTVAAMDLLVPGIGEIIGGSQREDDFEKLSRRMGELKLNKNDYWWYLDLRKYGGVEHSGFGLGFDRFIMYITGISNIRDVVPFPRVPKNADF